ncbi:uncharacterized protein C3F10.06c isoform X4 [Magnolia sinica]|uniref:uncharacterized protein C3F10.06c isoform X4 n=1 Tax=Magnolia sinica TaxID=86752 RepID=UPI002657B25D|nr:uncharacterized protein C3F10.06c isoform X4 [Magnolia sinica]
MAEEERMSIYRASRSIKRKENSLYNALRSIYEDSIFVAEIAELWRELPLFANLRCGLWYSSCFDSTCYFKSTDGHCNNWSFSTSRLNLHVAQLAGQKGGCIIVDSTRKGKRFPDSMSKTIPIWACVLNRAIKNHLQKIAENGPRREEELNTSHEAAHAGHLSLDWDCSLHLPLWVSKMEKAAIEDHLEEWTKQLEATGTDIASLALSLRKPLRTLWISPKTVIWLNEVPDCDSWDFTPVILVSASSSNGMIQQRTIAEFSWHYISGAGDDEESWARGLPPHLFWKNAFDLINAGPDLCNQRVAEIVEKDRVYRAQRGESAPQVIIKPHKISAISGDTFSEESNIYPSFLTSERSFGEQCLFSWLGSTNLAVGTTQHVTDAPNDIDCILNCDSESASIRFPSPDAYLHLPIVASKVNRFSLLNNLPLAVNFAKMHLTREKKLLVCCHNGSFDNGKSFKETCITKWEMRRRLVFICKFAINARPSRGNLKQVFSFLARDKISPSP